MTPACWVCGAPAAPAAELAPLPFVRCSACGLVFRAVADVQELYAEGAYEETHGERYASAAELADRRRDARVRLSWLAPHVRPGARLLDVGAAGGAFVAEAVAAGFAAQGIEPTPGFARHAHDRLGVDVEQTTLEAAALGSAEYGVITLWHVLEHVAAPLAQLVRLRGALVDGGVLALAVPNYGSVSAARMGRSWPSLEPDHHVNQFAPGSLRVLLARAGLEILACETVPITPYLTRAARLAPRHLAARAKAALALRDPRAVHPHGHELLRAAAQRRRSARSRSMNAARVRTA